MSSCEWILCDLTGSKNINNGFLIEHIGFICKYSESKKIEILYEKYIMKDMEIYHARKRRKFKKKICI